ncbi:MAG TPA: hypothetical protein VH040_01910 [Usitatibacter sp.]|jgi:hypothetical protein|nr:hypothetical protein [Usitatibacter sp.]
MRWLRISVLALLAAVVIAAALLFLIGAGQLVRTARGARVPATVRGVSPHRTQVVLFRDTVLANERSGSPAQLNAFESSTRELYWRSDALSGERLVIEYLRALALFDNAHSTIIDLKVKRVPLRFHWFSDGLYVVKVAPGLDPLLGAKVVGLEGRDPEELLRLLEPYVPGVPGWRRYRSEALFTSPAVLRALGASSDESMLLIDYEKPGQARGSLAVVVQASPPPGDAFREFRHVLPGDESFETKGWLRAGDAIAKKPLYLRDLPSPFARAWLPELKAEYLRLDGSNSTQQVDLPSFLDASVDEMEANGAKHAIVDLRFDWGGNYMLARRFAPRLASAIPADGRIFVITGPNTFSAGLILAARIKHFAGPRVVVVGEPVGDRLEFWAEGLDVELPPNDPELYLSTAKHDLAHGCRWLDRDCFVLDKLFPAAAGSLDVVLPARNSFADYMGGRDAALERIAAAISR